MTTIAHPHIELRADGTAFLEGTQTKVIELVLDRLAYNWDADELQRQHPDLSLAQIYSALAFYHDNQTQLDSEIEERAKKVRDIKRALGESPIRLKLKAQGLIP